MFHFLRGSALIAALILDYEIAIADVDTISANYMMPGCRTLLQTNPQHTWLAFSGREGEFKVMLLAAECRGTVEGLIYAASTVCLPIGVGVTREQSVRVVVQYIDSRPERLHEKFNALALEAMRAAWPCKN
jgi:hypothetical protein